LSIQIPPSQPKEHQLYSRLFFIFSTFNWEFTREYSDVIEPIQLQSIRAFITPVGQLQKKIENKQAFGYQQRIRKK
jgi:hypothetical protein